MSKAKIKWEIDSWGIYTQWDKNSKTLPVIEKHTIEIPAKIGIEFGYILRIYKAKGNKLKFCIDHPGILDEHGKRRKPFTGEVYVRNNRWDFFLGDTIWEPIDDKIGPWRLTIEMGNSLIADKTFKIIKPSD